MISSVRLKARYLQSGNVAVFTLYLLQWMMMVLCVNLLPLLYENFLSERIKALLPQQSGMIDFFVSFMIVLFAVTVFFALSSSVTRCFLICAEKKQIGVGDLFYYFSTKSVLHNLLFRLKLILLKSVGAIFFYLPFFFGCFLLYRSAERGVSLFVSFVMLAVTVAFFLAGAFFFCSFSSLMFLCPYMFFSGEGIKFKDNVLKSIRLMKNKRTQLVKIRLSFMGWFLLCLLVFPIGYVWSYYKQTLAVAALSFMKE